MMGAPMTGVTAFNGMMPFSPGNTQIRLHNKATVLPVRIVIGNRELWFSVPKISHATWGTAKPIKAMGPQKAVVIAVSKPVITNK